MNIFLFSNISHDEFVLINNMLKEYDDMKKKKLKIERKNQKFKDPNIQTL